MKKPAKKQKLRILLAEDDPNIMVISKLSLESFGGHDVDTATDGQEALDKALEGDYDLIILDEMMPKMNGLRVCSEIKQHKGPLMPPVIFLSAKSQANEIEAFRELAIGFIGKPFDPTQLCIRIEQLLKQAA